MCGRTACYKSPADLQRACTYKDKKGREHKPDWRDAPNGKSYFPSYNIAPGAYTPVLLSSHHSTDKHSSRRVIQPMLWGMIPSWHKGPQAGKTYETNNCRAESMLEKMTYKVPLQKGRRCVILAEGFFEWKKEKNSKQPYFIYQVSSNQEAKVDMAETYREVKARPKEVHSDTCEIKELLVKTSQANPAIVDVKQEAISNSNSSVLTNKESLVIKKPLVSDDKDIVEKEEELLEQMTGENRTSPRLLTMAGVFDVWKPADGLEPVYSYSVITVESSPAMTPIHHRMPALLTSDDEIEQWLSSGDVPLNQACKLIRSVTSVQHHPVSSIVNNSRNNSPECVKKVDPSKPKSSPGSSFMAAWLSKGQQVKPADEPPDKKMRVG